MLTILILGSSTPFVRNIGQFDTKVISNIRYDVDLIYFLSLSVLIIIIRNIAIMNFYDLYFRIVDSARSLLFLSRNW